MALSRNGPGQVRGRGPVSDARATSGGTTMSVPIRVERFWRLLATAFCFAVFGLGGLLLGLLYFPVLRLLSRDESQTRRNIQRAISRTFRGFAWLMKTVGVISFEIRGVEHLRGDGRLIVANHPTLIDVVLLIGLMPEVDCVVKRGLFHNPFLRWPVWWARYIPNDTPEKLVADCADSLRAGRSLIIFPEGTRTVPGAPLRMKRGAAQVALAADAWVVPVRIDCRPLMLSKVQPWYTVPPQKPHWSFDIGPAFAAREAVDSSCQGPLAARRLTEQFRHYFENGALRAVENPSPEAAPHRTTAVPVS